MGAGQATLPALQWGSRTFTLLFIVALHLLLVLLWPQGASHDQATPARLATELTFVTLRPVPERPAPLPVRPRKPQPPREAIRPRAVRESTLVAIPAPAIAPPPAVAPTPQPPERSTDDIMAQARRDVGRIDRDLRKSSLNIAERSTVLSATAREKAISAAYVGGGPSPIVESVAADGRRISRRGKMCAFKEHNGLVGGRDVFKDGVKTVWQQCPK